MRKLANNIFIYRTNCRVLERLPQRIQILDQDDPESVDARVNGGWYIKQKSEQ